MNFKRLLKTETGQIIISFLLGLGLATLFRKKCEEKDCLTFKGPDLEDIKKKKYKYGNNCFTYQIKSINCDDNKKNVEFA
jgi:hypothetical protein